MAESRGPWQHARWLIKWASEEAINSLLKYLKHRPASCDGKNMACLWSSVGCSTGGGPPGFLISLPLAWTLLQLECVLSETHRSNHVTAPLCPLNSLTSMPPPLWLHLVTWADLALCKFMSHLWLSSLLGCERTPWDRNTFCSDPYLILLFGGCCWVNECIGSTGILVQWLWSALKANDTLPFPSS